MKKQQTTSRIKQPETMFRRLIPTKNTIHYDQFLIGLELECFIPNPQRTIIARKKNELQLPFVIGSDGISDGTGKNGIATEIRCDGGQPYNVIVEKLKQLLELTAQADSYVTDGAGFHVHVSNKQGKFFEPKYLKRIVTMWSAIEDILIATQPESRYNNSYCIRYLRKFLQKHSFDSHSFPKAKADLLQKVQQDGHYHALNLSQLADLGTIEVRLHAGTRNYDKIINWVTLLLYFYSYCLNHYNHSKVMELFTMTLSEKKIAKAFMLLGLPNKLQAFYWERINKFSKKKSLIAQQAAAIRIQGNMRLLIRARKRVEKEKLTFNTLNKTFTTELQTFD